MRAARLHEHTEAIGSALSIEEIDRPSATERGDVLIEVGGAGLCGTDNEITKGDGPEVSLPLTPGHETAGTVVEVGEGVDVVAPGDDVACYSGITCGTCSACRRGESFPHCEHVDIPGMTRDGGFAEYLLTHERAVVPLSGLDPAAVAPAADAALSSYHPVKRAAAALSPTDHVAVYGIGGLGHVGVQFLEAMTAASIIAVDVRQEALAMAESYGAEHVIDSSSSDPIEEIDAITDGEGVSQVVDFVGTDGTLSTGPDVLATGGDYHVVGYAGGVDLPARAFVLPEIAYRGSRGGRFSEFEEVIDLLERGVVEIRTTEYPLEEINAAAAALHEGEVTGRIVIRP